MRMEGMDHGSPPPEKPKGGGGTTKGHGAMEMGARRASVPEVVAIALLSFALLGAGIAAANYGGNLSMSTRNMRQQMTYDRKFIDMMVPHHQTAIAMARMALERSQRPEIRRLAEAIIASQGEEIAEMRRYRREWYGSDATPPISEMPMIMEGMPMANDSPMDMQGDLEVLARDPRPFDLAFLDAMIPHHGSAIDASQHAPEQAVHPEIVSLAGRIIEAQNREIEQMRAWRAAWYPGQ